MIYNWHMNISTVGCIVNKCCLLASAWLFGRLPYIKFIYEQLKQLLIKLDQQTAVIEIVDSVCKLEEQAFDQLYRCLIDILQTLSWDHPQWNLLILFGRVLSGLKRRLDQKFSRLS